MYEHRRAPLAPGRIFARRIAVSFAAACALVLFSLGLGVAGYHVIARLSWIDSLVNASMILTGMGPVDPMPTAGAKIFASAYALFSGVAFLSIVGVIFAPVAHRFLHRFHLEFEDGPPRRRGPK